MMSAVRHCLATPAPPNISIAAVWIATVTTHRSEQGQSVSWRLANVTPLTGFGPQGVDCDLTSELLGHPQDAHGHAVLRHGVR